MALTSMTSKDLFAAALRKVWHRAGASVCHAEIRCDRDFVRDEDYVRLVVTHELLRGHWKAGQPDLRYLDERMRKALLVRDVEAKSISINRRRMLWRGSEARKVKQRKIK